MRAVILSAGRGQRLMPYTAAQPKCLVSVLGKPIVQWQIDLLLDHGIDQVVVVIGYGAEQVEKVLHDHYGDGVTCVFNPFHHLCDNLISAWMARPFLQGDCLLLNGDTLMDHGAMETVLAGKEGPVVLAVHRKPVYDGDDMKVQLQDERLVHVGKRLSDPIDAESIGCIRFNGTGAGWFCHALEEAVRDETSLGQWYLSVIDRMAGQHPVWTQDIGQNQWAELDCPADLAHLREVLPRWNLRKHGWHAAMPNEPKAG